MKDKRSYDWIKATLQFQKDPDAKVLCPDCQGANLQTKKVEWGDGEKEDLYLICPISRA
jgi:hypothetical protein